MFREFLKASLSIFVLLGARTGLAESPPSFPRVVASIKPIHSLVAGVMGQRGSLFLLIPGSFSEHGYTLKPSDARHLQQANLVFWIGDEMETYLTKPIQALPKETSVVTLADAKGIALLSAREDPAFEAHTHSGQENHKDSNHTHSEPDLHIWFNPQNAMAMVNAIVTSLSNADPMQAAYYMQNGENLKKSLAALDQEISESLRPLKGKPYIVSHDAYQYFEHRYGIPARGSLTLTPDQSPSAGRLKDIRSKIKNLGAVCVFAEPQIKPNLIETVIAGTQAKADALDPNGALIEPGPGLYFTLLRSNTAALVRCLSSP
jgi:zinc transport system substrate-binding protein